MFVLVKLLVFVPLFNAQKSMSYFALEKAAIVVARRKYRREQREHGRRERTFPQVLIYFVMPEEHIIRTYHLPRHVIFNLLQKIKDDLEPSTRSHAIPVLSNF